MGESYLLQKLQEIIRANPEQAESLFETFREILKEEKMEDLICSHCPLLNHRDEWGDANQMRVSESHSTDSIKIIQKRGAELRRKVAKKEQDSKRKIVARKEKEKRQSRRENGKQPEMKKHRKLGKKNMKTKKALQKRKKKKNKKILKMKKIKQKRKQGERQKTRLLEKMKELNSCTSLWAEFTNVGLGAASALNKQVHICKEKIHHMVITPS